VQVFFQKSLSKATLERKLSSVSRALALQVLYSDGKCEEASSTPNPTNLPHWICHWDMY